MREIYLRSEKMKAIGMYCVPIRKIKKLFIY